MHPKSHEKEFVPPLPIYVLALYLCSITHTTNLLQPLLYFCCKLLLLVLPTAVHNFIEASEMRLLGVGVECLRYK